MGKNLIPIIAKELGVEIGEEFLIKFYTVPMKYRFKNDVLEFKVKDGIWEQSGLKVIELKDVEVIKLPFEPKDGESYWTYDLFSTDFKPYPGHWGDRTKDYLRKNCGCVFRTEQEAIKARPAKYKELTGKEWGCDDEK